MIPKIYQQLAVIAAIFLAGAGSAWFISSNIYTKKIAVQQSDWNKQIADAQKERGDALEKVIALTNQLTAKSQEIGNEVQKAVDDTKSKSSGTIASLRSALTKACRDRSVPASSPASGVDHGEAYSDGLRDGIAEGLERRIAAPATIQTIHLIGAQRYINEVCSKACTVPAQ